MENDRQPADEIPDEFVPPYQHSRLKSKDEHGFVILELISLTFHICRANSNGGLLPRTIVGPNGVQVVALVNSSTGSSDSHGNDIR